MALSERFEMQYDLLACSQTVEGQPVLIRMSYTISELAAIRAVGDFFAAEAPVWLKDRQRFLGEAKAKIHITLEAQSRVLDGYLGDPGFVSIHH